MKRNLLRGPSLLHMMTTPAHRDTLGWHKSRLEAQLIVEGQQRLGVPVLGQQVTNWWPSIRPMGANPGSRAASLALESNPEVVIIAPWHPWGMTFRRSLTGLSLTWVAPQRLAWTNSLTLARVRNVELADEVHAPITGFAAYLGLLESECLQQGPGQLLEL